MKREKQRGPKREGKPEYRLVWKSCGLGKNLYLGCKTSHHDARLPRWPYDKAFFRVSRNPSLNVDLCGTSRGDELVWEDQNGEIYDINSKDSPFVLAPTADLIGVATILLGGKLFVVDRSKRKSGGTLIQWKAFDDSRRGKYGGGAWITYEEADVPEEVVQFDFGSFLEEQRALACNVRVDPNEGCLRLQASKPPVLTGNISTHDEAPPHFCD